MAFENLFVLLIGIALALAVIRFSAQAAYKKPVTWEETIIQLVLLVALFLFAGFLLGFVNPNSTALSVLEAFG
jgi:hypothetical protein